MNNLNAMEDATREVLIKLDEARGRVSYARNIEGDAQTRKKLTHTLNELRAVTEYMAGLLQQLEARDDEVERSIAALGGLTKDAKDAAKELADDVASAKRATNLIKSVTTFIGAIRGWLV